MRLWVGAIRRLSPQERRLAAEAVLALAFARLALAILPFRLALRCHGLVRTARRTDTVLVPASEVEALGRMVSRVAGHMPFKAVCLQQALAASMMLRRRGRAAEVHFGVARNPDGKLEAHAWCISAGQPITGTAIAELHVPLAQFSTATGSLPG